MIECPACETPFKGLECECGYRIQPKTDRSPDLPPIKPNVHIEIPPCPPDVAWAHRLKVRHESGEILAACQVSSYRAALNIREAA